MTDELEHLSNGEVQDSWIAVEKARERLDGALNSLGIDHHGESMPSDHNSIEYRVRDAYNLLRGVEAQLEEETHSRRGGDDGE